MNKLLIASLLAAITSNASAQQAECIIDEKPHYFVATGTAKTENAAGGLRTFGLVSKDHKDLAACDEALELLRAQIRINAKNGLPGQKVAYEGFCIATEICP